MDIFDTMDLLVNPHRQADADSDTREDFEEYYAAKIGPIIGREPGARTMETTTELSKGHVATIGDFEYFHNDDGNLYRAPADRPLDIWGYRLGARFECMGHMTKQCMALKSQQTYRLF